MKITNFEELRNSLEEVKDALGKEEGQAGVLFLLDILVNAVRELIIIEIREHVGLQVIGKFSPLVVSQFRCQIFVKVGAGCPVWP